MALTADIKWFVSVLDDGTLEVRRTRVIFEDGEVVAEKHFRYVLQPGADVSSEPLRIRRIAQAVWS